MALDKLVDSSQLDSDLTSVANAIRTKSGGSSQLAFPADFVSAIAAIPTGGGSGGISLIGSGSFTRASTSPVNLSISVSYTGTPTILMLCVDTPLDATAQGIAVIRVLDPGFSNTHFSTYYPYGIISARTMNTSNTLLYVAPNDTIISLSGTTMTVNRISSGAIWQPNDYKWYIWGTTS